MDTKRYANSNQRVSTCARNLHVVNALRSRKYLIVQVMGIAKSHGAIRIEAGSSCLFPHVQ